MLPRSRPSIPAALLAAAVALGSLLAGSLVAGAPTAAPEALALGPLPACTYEDVLTSPRAYTAWKTTLVDTILRVPATYVPPDLVPVSNAGIGGSGLVRAVVIDDLAAMTKAAAAAGTPIAVQSAYRSYATQVTTFQYWVNLDGYARALLYSARPGHSEHQLGVAIDFKSAAGGPPWSGSDWALSPAGSWMKANAWQYGFILSYPKGERSKTCYDYEAWHYRYVGREEAAAIHASGLTTREYLWRHFTTVDLDIGTPQGPSPSPAAPASPSPHPTATATTQPSDGPSNLPSLAPTSAPTTPAPIESSPPIDVPTGSQVTFLGLDAATAAISGGLVILLIALVFSVGMARRRHGSSDPPGPGLKG